MLKYYRFMVLAAAILAGCNGSSDEEDILSEPSEESPVAAAPAAAPAPAPVQPTAAAAHAGGYSSEYGSESSESMHGGSEYGSGYGMDSPMENYGGDNYNPEGSSPGAQAAAPPPPPDPMTLGEGIEAAFALGNEPLAARIAMAAALAGDNADAIFEATRWSPVELKPVLTHRLAIGIEDNAPEDLKEFNPPYYGVMRPVLTEGRSRSKNRIDYAAGGSKHFATEPEKIAGLVVSDLLSLAVAEHAEGNIFPLLAETEVEVVTVKRPAAPPPQANAGGESNQYGSGDPYGGSDPYGSGDPYGGSDPYGSGDPYGGSDPSGGSGDPYGGSDPYGSSGDPYASSNPSQAAQAVVEIKDPVKEAIAKPEMPRLAPGVFYLGRGKTNELVEKAKEADIRLVIIYDVELKQSRVWLYNTVQAKMMLADNPRPVALSPKIENKVVIEKTAESRPDYVTEQLTALREKLQAGFRLQPIPPAITPEVLVNNRLPTLMSDAARDPLAAAFEIKFWHARGLLNDEQQQQAMEQILGSRAELLATDETEAKTEMLMKLVAK